MTSLIKNQVLKHLTKFFKDLAPEQLQLSAFKGSCELSNLQLEEKVLMELLSFPAWIRINKAVCDQLTIRIPWTKIKSVPIQMSLNEVTVEVEVCEEFCDISTNEDEMNLSSLINTQAPSKYGFVDRVIDGITVTVNNVLITFKSKLMAATFNLSRVLLESRCPSWKPGELSLTRIKDTKRGQILLFKIVDWQTMRLEAKCLTDPDQAPLRLITNHAQCRLTIKKNLDDCSVVAASIFVIFEDILWVLTFAQFISAASFVEYVFSLIKRSPVSKKSGLLDNQSALPTRASTSNNSSFASSSFVAPQSAPLISPLNTPVHSSQPDKASILTGNLSSASLLEQKFLCYDLVETSLHLYIDKVDAHLYDDIETNTPSSKSGRDSGGALQTTLDHIQVDCYPYSRAISDRKHWYRWFDPSPNSRKQWLKSHFAEFDLNKVRKSQTAKLGEQNQTTQADLIMRQTAKKQTPIAADEQLLSLTVLVKIKDYCMNCVATRHSMRGNELNKFIQTDKDYQMPSEMPSLYLELNYFYYFDAVKRMMVYDDVPDPLAFIHLSPTKLLFDSATLVFLNSFHVNLSKAFVHLNDLFPEETTAPKIHCRVEILIPQIILPAKSNSDQPFTTKASSLLVKSGKITLSNSLYDKEIIAKLLSSIERLKENPSQPINLGGNYQSNFVRKDNSCTGDWTRVWNSSLINDTGEFSIQDQLWTIQFEPVWMDFMNYDVDQLSYSQRLEPIVEPVNAYAFIHLDLSSSSTNQSNKIQSLSTEVIESDSKKDKRDVISILFSVIDGSILANMDKIQFSFLQRLGMHVEKLIQRIKEDASSVIQLDTVVEDTLEVNLTAYIRDIKARLILDKKIEFQSVTVNDTATTTTTQLNRDPQLLEPKIFHPNAMKTKPSNIFPSVSCEPPKVLSGNSYFNMIPINPFESEQKGDGFSNFAAAYSPDDDAAPAIISSELDTGEPLDDCVEVADDTSLFLGDNAGKNMNDSTNETTTSATTNALNINDFGRSSSGDASTCTGAMPGGSDGSLRSSGKSPIEESLLINLDEMEQSSQLFVKMDIKSAKASPQPSQSTGKDCLHAVQPNQQQQQQQQDIETESISYLELSMSQLMVRRITETKRRQKF